MTTTRSSQRRSKSPETHPYAISPEVEDYLLARRYPLPDKHPLIKTPEPRHVAGARFDGDRVDRVIRALGALKHTKGRWAGTPLVPTAIQIAYIIAPIFGWVKKDEFGEWRRIIRDAYIEMPRKGAKTTISGGLSMYLAFADGEGGAEVLLGAASKDQAGQAFKPLSALVRSSEALRRAGIKTTKTELYQPSTDSVCKVVSSRGDLAHGTNVHGGLVDELHVHKNGDLLEAIESGTGARSQPLVIIITTADDGQTTSVYAQRRAFIEKIANGSLKVPSMYGVVFAVPEEMDPYDEKTWDLANPLYPVTPSPEFMRSAADKAKADSVAFASFQRLHLGIRAKTGTQYIDMKKWDQNGGLLNELSLRGKTAYGGLDLSSVSDLTALSWIFPQDGGGYRCLWRFWLPEASLRDLDASTSRMASAWVKDGWITLTPGDVVDYAYVRKTIMEDMSKYDVVALGYDRWNSSHLITELQAEEVPLIQVGQGVASLSAPLKEINRLIRTGTEEQPMLVHGGNPVAKWMADNLRVWMDAAGNVKPDKGKSTEKIDGMSSLTTAMAVAMMAAPEQVSAYDDHDLIIV